MGCSCALSVDWTKEEHPGTRPRETIKVGPQVRECKGQRTKDKLPLKKPGNWLDGHYIENEVSDESSAPSNADHNESTNDLSQQPFTIVLFEDERVSIERGAT